MSPEPSARALAKRILAEVVAEHEGAASGPSAERPDTPAWRSARRLVDEALADERARAAAATPAPSVPTGPPPPPIPHEAVVVADDDHGPLARQGPRSTAHELDDREVPTSSDVPSTPVEAASVPEEAADASRVATSDVPDIAARGDAVRGDGVRGDGVRADEAFEDEFGAWPEPVAPHRTGRWLLATVLGALALALLLPLAIGAVRDLVSLS